MDDDIFALPIVGYRSPFVTPSGLNLASLSQYGAAPSNSGLVYGTQPVGPTNTAADSLTQWSLLDRLLGRVNPETGKWEGGMGTQVIDGIKGLTSAYLGMKQYGLAQDALKEGRRQFDLNYNNQRQLINSQLEDRQRARVASNPYAYQSVDEYMNQNRIR